MTSKNLKRRCKTRHGMDDEEYKRIKMKIYSCKYYKKLFSRSINCLYHEHEPKEAGDISYRADFQFGAGMEFVKFAGSSFRKTMTWIILSLH